MTVPYFIYGKISSSPIHLQDSEVQVPNSSPHVITDILNIQPRA